MAVVLVKHAACKEIQEIWLDIQVLFAACVERNREN